MPTISAPGRDDFVPFHCDIEPERGCVRVVPSGELDLATTPQLERHLRDLTESGFDHVVLDLRRLVFMDSTGIRVILKQNALAQAEGRTFELVAGPRAVQRALEVAGVLDLLPFRPA